MLVVYYITDNNLITEYDDSIKLKCKIQFL